MRLRQAGERRRIQLGAVFPRQLVVGKAGGEPPGQRGRSREPGDHLPAHQIMLLQQPPQPARHRAGHAVTGASGRGQKRLRVPPGLRVSRSLQMMCLVGERCTALPQRLVRSGVRTDPPPATRVVVADRTDHTVAEAEPIVPGAHQVLCDQLVQARQRAVVFELRDLGHERRVERVADDGGGLGEQPSRRPERPQVHAHRRRDRMGRRHVVDDRRVVVRPGGQRVQQTGLPTAEPVQRSATARPRRDREQTHRVGLVQGPERDPPHRTGLGRRAQRTEQVHRRLPRPMSQHEQHRCGRRAAHQVEDHLDGALVRVVHVVQQQHQRLVLAQLAEQRTNTLTGPVVSFLWLYPGCPGRVQGREDLRQPQRGARGHFGQKTGAARGQQIIEGVDEHRELRHQRLGHDLTVRHPRAGAFRPLPPRGQQTGLAHAGLTRQFHHTGGIPANGPQQVVEELQLPLPTS